jgi:CxxC-x17-CxxC domain-containing protein
MFQDKVITCKQCGAEFTFTAGEQQFYAEKGLTNEPQRCKACRDSMKRDRKDRKGDKTMFDAVCAQCGKKCKVPFEPKEDRPVYCSECFSRK